MENVLSKERLQWVDAMRGFSMIIVVFGHVLLSMGIGGYSSFLSSILLTFRMPLFFFVSGFFSYRVITWWSRNRVLDILKRKIQAQIICTLVFLLVYQYVTCGEINLDHGFGGYWFTIVLFQMYLLYLFLSLLSRLIHHNIVIPGLIIASLLGIAILTSYSRDSWVWEFFCWENLTKYLQFFTLGLICSKYRHLCFRLLENGVFCLIAVVGWIICMILWYNTAFEASFPAIYSFVHDIAVRYFALTTVVIMFHGSQKTFTGNSRYSNVLKFIGQRTLDIYMIHYFFIPNLSFLSDLMNQGNMLVIQLIVGLTITAVVVALCLLISSILRKSCYLEQWLFGVKYRVVKQ